MPFIVVFCTKRIKSHYDVTKVEVQRFVPCLQVPNLHLLYNVHFWAEQVNQMLSDTDTGSTSGKLI